MLKQITDRFYAAIKKQPDGGCWLWINRSTTRFGYGQLWYGPKRWAAHRLSWVIHRGEIPTGMCVCHHCDIPACVNPEHLFLDTQRGNLRDMRRKNRGHSGYRATPPLGSTNAKAKLTESQIPDIRRRYESGESLGQLGKSYGAWKSTIYQVVLRRTWRQIK